jgi:hypothetical protein
MFETMRRPARIASVLCLLAAGITAMAMPAIAAPAEKYLHVNVQDPTKGENVNINVTLAMAQAILPAINNHGLHGGKVTIRNSDMNDVDFRQLLDAVRTAPDNEFVTVKDHDSDVRVAKAGENIVIHVTDKKNKEEKVDITVPLKIVDALFSSEKNGELDLSAALRALSDAGDAFLVTVQDSAEKVRIWVDSRNTQD